MKNKSIIKSLLFVFILFLLLLVLSYIFVPKNNTEESGMDNANANGILGKEKNTVDMLILGNSISMTSIIPNKLYEDCGYRAYICGTPGQVLPDTIYYMVNGCKNQNIKTIIIEADIIYSIPKITTPAVTLSETFMPIVKHHDRWKQIKLNEAFSKVNYTWTDEKNGYHASTAIEPADNSNYMKDIGNEKEEICFQNKISLKIINEYCKKNNIDLIIVSTPNVLNWSYKKHNSLKDFTEKENIEFLDLNLVIDELSIDWINDSRDKGDHLNDFGAEKVTNYFEKYMQNRNHQL